MKAVLKNRRETYREHIISPIDPILAAITLALLVFGSIFFRKKTTSTNQ